VWKKGLSGETQEIFASNPAMWKLYADMDPRARNLLTLCNSPCVPLGADKGQTDRILELIKKHGLADDDPLLKEYLHRRGGSVDGLTKAIDDLDAAADPADLRKRLLDQKKIDDKILVGEQAAPQPPGTVPSGAAREIRGAHSPSILTDPNFRIKSQSVNADGTIEAEFDKLLHPGPPPVFSKKKTSTLAPPSWTDADMLRAGDAVGALPPIQTRIRDRATLHKGTVNGVEWVVVKDASGKVTASFPTGGKPFNL
jgi:hypothetical protein